MHVCKDFWKPHLSTLLFPNPEMDSIIYSLLLDMGLKFPSPTPAWNSRSQTVKKMITCEPGCSCVNWLIMFEWCHVWTGYGRVNEVVTCERVRSNSGGYLWTGCSFMNGVWSCERGRHVNWVRCDTFYFEFLIRHTERASNRETCLYADM